MPSQPDLTPTAVALEYSPEWRSPPATDHAEMVMSMQVMTPPVVHQRRHSQRAQGNGMRAVLSGSGCPGACARINDLSRGGMAVATEWQPQVGAAVAVALDGALAPIYGRVIRTQPGTLAVAFGQDEANLALVDQVLNALTTTA